MTSTHFRKQIASIYEIDHYWVLKALPRFMSNSIYSLSSINWFYHLSYQDCWVFYFSYYFCMFILIAFSWVVKPKKLSIFNDLFYCFRLVNWSNTSSISLWNELCLPLAKKHYLKGFLSGQNTVFKRTSILYFVEYQNDLIMCATKSLQDKVNT